MNTKRIIILGGGFGEVKCAETLCDGIAAWPERAFQVGQLVASVAANSEAMGSP